MNRLTVLGSGLAFLIVVGGLYTGLQVAGIENLSAQWWTSLGLLGALLVWVGSYVSRVLTGSMAFHQQRQTYTREILKQQIASLSPEELAALTADLDDELQDSQPPA